MLFSTSKPCLKKFYIKKYIIIIIIYNNNAVKKRMQCRWEVHDKQSGITVGVTVCVAANLSSQRVANTLVIHTGCDISYTKKGISWCNTLAKFKRRDNQLRSSIENVCKSS